MSETHEHQIVIAEPQAGMRLDQALAAVFDQYSRSAIKSWIDAGQVTLNDNRPRPRDIVAFGDQIHLRATLEGSVDLVPEAVDFNEKFADEFCLVVEKPAGCVVHPGAGNRSRTLVNGLLNRYPELAALPRAGLIHRLDKDTSGLLLVARSAFAFQHLTQQMAKREIRRTYSAICNGQLISGATVNEPIGRDPNNRLRMAVRRDGRVAITHFRVIEKFRAHTLIEVTLETGRTHQIRVHLSHLGHPLVGDTRYGARLRLPRHPTASLEQALTDLNRHALHAIKLGFWHPLAKTAINIESQMPPSLSKIIEAARDDKKNAQSERSS